MDKRVLFTTVAFAALTYGIFGQQPGKKAAGTAPAAEKEFVISTTSQLVLLDVSVKDSAGGFAAGLTKDNFRVTEDGKPQTISQFADSDIPVTIGLAIDESGSMRSKRPEVITAALAFIQASNPQDEMFVLNFNERVRRGLPDTVMFSDNVKQLRAALSSGIPEGRTALYDSIVEGLKQLEMGRKDKKTLIVVSDGGDNISKATLKDVVRLVEESVATIYTIGVFDQDDPDRNPASFEKASGNQRRSGAIFRISWKGSCRYVEGSLKRSAPAIRSDIYRLWKERNCVISRYRRPLQDRGKLVARTRTLYAFPDEQMTARSK